MCYRARMRAEELISTIITLLAPVGLIYSWFFYFARIRKEPSRWRNRASFSSMTLVSLVVLTWPLMVALVPKVDWVSGNGVDREMQWVEAWHPPILRALLVALVLAFLGRPRLILPMGVACVGTAMFWIMSTMP